MNDGTILEMNRKTQGLSNIKLILSHSKCPSKTGILRSQAQFKENGPGNKIVPKVRGRI